jgi:hypothetical protein
MHGQVITPTHAFIVIIVIIVMEREKMYNNNVAVVANAIRVGVMAPS